MKFKTEIISHVWNWKNTFTRRSYCRFQRQSYDAL